MSAVGVFRGNKNRKTLSGDDSSEDSVMFN
jgi:hypothetical protein